jgi:hypothetical protein
MTLVFESDLSEVKYMIPAHVAAATGNRPEKIIPAETGKLSSGDKFVLVALADNAADDGGSIYPSIETLVKKTQMSERGCQIALRHLEAAGINGEHPEGLLVLEHEEHTLWMAKGFLRKTRTYRLNVDLLATFRPPEGKKAEGAVSAGLVGGRGHQVRGGGGSECGVDPAVSAPDSSVVTVHRNQKKQKHNPAPDDGAAERAQAVQGGLLLEAVVVEAGFDPAPPGSAAPPSPPAAAAPAVSKVVNLEYPAAFETYWKALPEKAQACGKKAAFEKWKKALKDGASGDEIMAGLDRWKASRQWADGFINHATTWLHQERWKVHPEAAGSNRPATPAVGRQSFTPADYAGHTTGDYKR